MDNFFKQRNYLTIGVLIFGLAFVLGYNYGKNNKSEEEKLSLIIRNTSFASTTTDLDFEPFWLAWRKIDEHFVGSASSTDVTDGKARLYGAISGMTSAMEDPYTVYFPPVETKAFDEQISGQIEGVGMEIDIRDGVLTVVSPIKNSPAYKAGVKTGDKILKIDDRITEKMPVEEAVKLIRGKKGTSVKLLLYRAGEKEPLEKSIVRDFINLPTVDTEIKGKVFIVRLYSFSQISPGLFRDALREFYESGLDKIIIDLRGNPGGYLEAAWDMASWFLPAGEVVVREVFKNEEDNQTFRSRGYNVFSDTLKMAILIDAGSASASEILAGALKDHGRAILVGKKSFGKGSVQELFEITDNPKTSLKVTIAKWLTPNGISISDHGLKPDFEVELDEEAYKKDKTDTQLDKAIEILNQ
ncbi:MAG: S41 family peptidase [Minisyncoccia bacterium]